MSPVQPSLSTAVPGRAAVAVAIALLLVATPACRDHRKQSATEAARPAAGPLVAPAIPPAVPFAGPAADGKRTKLLRFPDVQGELIVFTYAGDLWLVPTSGGTASRLTAHPGLEQSARFSPDGKWIAFTGQYDGDDQVYVIPTSGGEPRQLTFYPAVGPLPPRWGFDNQVMGWTPDGKEILFRSQRDADGINNTRLYRVPATGGLPQPLPMVRAGAGDLDRSGTKLVYSPLFRDFRTWKRYAGGWAQDLYLFDLTTEKATRLTDNPRSDRDPMWVGDQIYFSSDRDDTNNLYRAGAAPDQATQITHYTDADVRWPSSDGTGQIVFERNGELSLLTTADDKVRDLAIYVPDDEVRTRPQRIDARPYIEQIALGPTGKRALVVARGDLFTVPAEHGPTRNLTHSSNAHEREAAWSPDGKQLVYVSDWTGEEQLWLATHDGSEPPRPISDIAESRLYHPVWAPVGGRIAFHDHTGTLLVLTVASGKVTEVARDPWGGMAEDYSWSPDGGYLAFTLHEPTQLGSIHLWRARDGQTARATSADFDDYAPTWHPDGKHLYFLSDREFSPQLTFPDFDYARNRSTEIFALALTQSAGNPVGPRDDVPGSRDQHDHKQEAEADKSAPKPPPAVRVDFDGLIDRIVHIPVVADNLGGLVATEKYLIYARHDDPFIGREPETPGFSVKIFSLKERKDAELAGGVNLFSVSTDGKKILLRDAESKAVTVRPIDFPGAGAKGPSVPPPGATGPGGDKKPKVVRLDDLVVERIPAEEWAVIFDEVWRRYREYFYAANMNGNDWKAIGREYRAQLPYVGHRADLNDLLGQMIAELSNSHCYVEGGDLGLPPRAPSALIGARLERAPSGHYRIAEIYPGNNAEERYRSPLTEVGVDVKVGDYLLAVNGQPIGPDQNPYQLLRLPADQPLELTVSAAPSGVRARRVLVRPVATEQHLRYLRWVERNRRQVTEETDGRVGYLHLPDMGANGLREFNKWYYGQTRKQGLIVDVRANGGGFTSQLFIRRLLRPLLGTHFDRNSQLTYTYPAVVFHGPKVALINETSASDGDIFPYMFRDAGLGPLIGKRTWGGVVGISGHGPLIDGGEVYVPEDGYASADGQWVIEGTGVAPDIEVDNDPVAAEDAQLERGIQEVLARMKAHPTPLPTRPPDPIKTKRTPAAPPQ